jgi:hypothetical protein
VIGAEYLSTDHAMTYVVLDRATLWELAPLGAIRVRWANGNETVTDAPLGADVLVGLAPAGEAEDVEAEEAVA